MLVSHHLRGMFTEIHADSLAEDGFSVEGGTHAEGFFGGAKDDDDAAEGLERGPGGDGGVVGDCLADFLEGCWVEDFGVEEVLWDC